MVASGVAWAVYVPIPGLAWLLVRLAPHDRLVRHHGLQASLLVGGAWLALLVLGLMQETSLARAAYWTSGLVLALIVMALVAGTMSALRGRYLRIRPAWDLATILHRTPATRAGGRQGKWGKVGESGGK